jgi:DNA polymerase-1
MSNKKTEKLMIIDGNALIHRSFHALPPTMRTKSGEMTNAVFGFSSFLIKAIKDLKPEYVVLTLDRKEATFRHKEYKEYKATRVKAPDELYAQIPRVKEIAEAFDIPIFDKAGFEADDLIGTIAKSITNYELRITNKNIETIIVTGDMDTMQLVNDYTKVYTMSRGISDSMLYDIEAVKERYGGLAPEQMTDYKALRGDPSDNIPGVKGIGEKTAIELLIEFNNLENLYDQITNYELRITNSIKPRILELLKVHKEDAFLSKRLATIDCNVPIKFDLEKSRFRNFDQNKVQKIFSELEFKSLLPRVKELTDQGDKGRSKEEKAERISDKFERNKNLFKYTLVDNENLFKKFLAELKKQPAFTFDTETTGLDPITCGLLGVSFSWKEKEAYFVKIKNQKSKIKNIDLFSYQNKKEEITSNPWLEKLKPILEDEKIKKYAHNGKFDIRVLKNNGIDVKNFVFDTMIASYLLNPGSRQHSLDAVTFSELGFEKISKDDLLGRAKEKITFGEVAVEKLSLYSCEDADFTNRLVKKLSAELKKQDLIKLFNDIEIALVPVLVSMEENGIKVDEKILAKMSEEMSTRIKSLEKKIHKMAGMDFNISSPQQLQEVLFEKLEIPLQGIKKNKTGISTAADELVKLKELHPIITLIQEYRELTKLTSTYVNALPNLINPKTKRVHTSFNQTVAATGRLSSSDPNLQNIPIKTDLGREIRKAFVAEKGYKIIGLDYSQIELRLVAHMSGDKKMIKAFQIGEDIHASTAAEINQVPLNEVTKEMRREAKAVNFGILYGQGPHGLSQTADISYMRAKEFIDKYFETFPDIKKYIDEYTEFARANGYAETMFGRKRYLPEINSSVMMVRKGAERMAINTPLQGTAADMIKIAMVSVWKEIKDDKEIKMLLQVHDELLFEVKEDNVDEYIKKIKEIMEKVIKLKVPVVVDASLGGNWGELLNQLSIIN